MEETFLCDLLVGERAQILKINASSIKSRLLELGVIVGEIIEVKARSIFKSPMLIKVCDYELCIGIKYAKTIVVKSLMDKNKA